MATGPDPALHDELSDALAGGGSAEHLRWRIGNLTIRSSKSMHG